MKAQGTIRNLDPLFKKKPLAKTLEMCGAEIWG